MWKKQGKSEEKESRLFKKAMLRFQVIMPTFIVLDN